MDFQPQTPLPPSGVPERRPWLRRLSWALGLAAFFYATVAADVVWRARGAYLEGEKYWRWHENPAEKEAYFKAEFEKAKSGLDREKRDGKVDSDEYDRRLEILEFDRDRRLRESSIKYAYVWYQTAYELFSPPESRWVRLSREKAPLAKEKWKDELRARKIPFEDYMLE